MANVKMILRCPLDFALLGFSFDLLYCSFIVQWKIITEISAFTSIKWFRQYELRACLQPVLLSSDRWCLLPSWNHLQWSHCVLTAQQHVIITDMCDGQKHKNKTQVVTKHSFPLKLLKISSNNYTNVFKLN